VTGLIASIPFVLLIALGLSPLSEANTVAQTRQEAL
jgi:hypothetical protein